MRGGNNEKDASPGDALLFLPPMARLWIELDSDWSKQHTGSRETSAELPSLYSPIFWLMLQRNKSVSNSWTDDFYRREPLERKASYRTWIYIEVLRDSVGKAVHLYHKPHKLLRFVLDYMFCSIISSIRGQLPRLVVC